jgi:probable phosphoglycerate mutase
VGNAVSSVRLCVVRHGQTAWNVDRRFQGWSDTPLNDHGRGQARTLGDELAGRVFDVVWSSDLRRAIETAQIVAGEPRVDRRLREMDFGDLEGTSWSDMDPVIRSAIDRFDGFVAPRGESAAQMRSRVVEFLDELDPGFHLIVTHGGVIRMLRRECGGDGFPGHDELTEIDWTTRSLA